MGNVAKNLADLLEKARPTIISNEPDPQGRRGYRRGFAGLFGDLQSDDPKFQWARIESEAALFELDHRWWPKHREAVIHALEAAQVIADQFPASYPDGEYAVPHLRLVQALSALNEV